MRVYLAGPIAGCDDEAAKGWREKAKALRPDITWVDPMEYMDARGLLFDKTTAGMLTGVDKMAIDGCDAVLRNAERPTEGSAQETMYAFMRDIRVVAFTHGLEPAVSPWVLAHCHVHPSLEAAVAAL